MSKTSIPRLAPIPKQKWTDAAREALRQGFPEAAPAFLSEAEDAPRIPNVLGTLMHHAELIGPFFAYNVGLLKSTVIEPRARELMILRVAWRTSAGYEWAQHVRAAIKFGVTEAELNSVARDEIDPTAWPVLEADLLIATDELLDHHRIQDDTWARLAAQLDERQLVELVFIVGTYSCLAMAFNSFGLQLDPGLKPAEGIPYPEEASDEALQERSTNDQRTKNEERTKKDEIGAAG